MKTTVTATPTQLIVERIYANNVNKPQRIMRMRDAFIAQTDAVLQAKVRRLWGSIQGMFQEKIRWQEGYKD